MEKYRKEVWIRIPSTEYADECKDFILSLGEEDLLGEIPVVLYSTESRCQKMLSHIYDVDVAAINVLREKYGDENVKALTQPYEEHVPPDQEMAHQIRRIADALEGIADSLEALTDPAVSGTRHPLHPDRWER